MAESVTTKKERDFGERAAEVVKRAATVGVVVVAAFCIAT